ncbi:MAG: ribulose phosphate epimerase [Myxococcales bacterium]|nr:ribulose phosphate epimerase [Myxococcales bacterium]
MRRVPLPLVLLLACSSDTVAVDGSTTGSASSDDATATPATASASTSPSTSTSGTDETTEDPFGGFVDDDLDAGSSWAECSIYAQDCPPGLRCVPYSVDGGVWNTWGCFPTSNDPVGPGEPCMAQGNGTSGIDDCAIGSMCWNVDPETHEGTCVTFCIGGNDAPYCEDPDQHCAIAGDGVIVLCLPRCHPLEDDCPEGQGCYPINEDFQCAPDASGELGASGDPCEYLNGCSPSTFCAAAEAVPECAGSIGCCSSFCTIGDDSACLPSQTCQPWFEPGNAPPGFDDIGGCALP